MEEFDGTSAMNIPCAGCKKNIGSNAWVTWVDDSGIEIYKCIDCFTEDVMKQFEGGGSLQVQKGDN